MTVTAKGPEGSTGVGPVAAVASPDSPQFYDVDVLLDAIGRWQFTLDIEAELGARSPGCPAGRVGGRGLQPDIPAGPRHRLPGPGHLDVGPGPRQATAKETKSIGDTSDLR